MVREFRMLSALLAMSLCAFATPAMASPPGETGLIEHRYEILDPIDFLDVALSAEVFSNPALPANLYPGEFEALAAKTPGVTLSRVVQAGETPARLLPAVYDHVLAASPPDHPLIC